MKQQKFWIEWKECGGVWCDRYVGMTSVLWLYWRHCIGEYRFVSPPSLCSSIPFLTPPFLSSRIPLSSHSYGLYPSLFHSPLSPTSYVLCRLFLPFSSSSFNSSFLFMYALRLVAVPVQRTIVLEMFLPSLDLLPIHIYSFIPTLICCITFISKH